MRNKVILGTANFGLQYGISNKKKLSRQEVFNILELAHAQGIWGIDTARAYGNAEKLIGEFFKEHGKVFNVTGKLVRKEYQNTKDVEDEIFGSLKDMNISSIDSFLIHSFETYRLYGKTVIPVLQSLCRDKVIGRYGVSVYHPEEAVAVKEEVKDNLAIEFPLNLFDQRFLKNSFMQSLQNDGNILFARSVFLQGLFFLRDDERKGKFEKVRGQITRIRNISQEYNMRTECLALLFVITKSLVDGMVIGIDSTGQLMSNIECFSEESLEKYKRAEHLLSDLEVCDEDIILPYRWKV